LFVWRQGARTQDLVPKQVSKGLVLWWGAGFSERLGQSPSFTERFLGHPTIYVTLKGGCDKLLARRAHFAAKKILPGSSMTKEGGVRGRIEGERRCSLAGPPPKRGGKKGGRAAREGGSP